MDRLHQVKLLYIVPKRHFSSSSSSSSSNNMSGAPDGIYQPGVIDPGVPNPNGTASYWLSQPSPYAQLQSPWPTTVDVAIIGSGMSGVSLAKTLYEKRPDLRIVILDARDMCSGATGRNGGHVKTITYATWPGLKELHGVEEALRVAAFEQSHLPEITATIEKYKIDCDLHVRDGLDTYYDQHFFRRSVAALQDLRAYAPSLAQHYTVYTSREDLDRFKLTDRCVGAIRIKAASIWVYKFVTGLLARLVEDHGLNVQANTPVLGIDDHEGEEFAVVKTIRGEFKARQVVHATNGWIGHLVPELRPLISPVRGNVTRQVPPAEFRLKSSVWSRYGDKDYDYLIQRPKGDIVVGRANLHRVATADDSEIDMLPHAHLRGISSQIFKTTNPNQGFDVTHSWSGILGFTQDKSPFVGKLPLPGRSHQWICGGYQGYGMTKAFKTPQMLAALMLGEEVPKNYPRSMIITPERIKSMQRTLSLHKL